MISRPTSPGPVDAAAALVEAEANAARFAFLAEVGQALSSSLDPEETLRGVVRMAIPELGDLCIVDLVDAGQVRRVAAAHVRPEKVELLEELRRRHPAAGDSPQPAARVLRSGEPELLVEVTPDVVASHTVDPDHARLIRALGMRSHLAVPLVARGITLGVLSLAITESDRRYGPGDVAFALELAGRAALAVDNARLYRAAQQELAERRRAEEALRLSEWRFRALFEQSPLSSQLLSADGKTMRVNRAFEDLWGVGIEALADYDIRHDPQLAARGIAPYLERAFAGVPVEIPAALYDPEETLPGRTRHADAARWVRGFAYPVKDGAGVVREVMLLHEDVTHRRAAEVATSLLADAGASLGASLDTATTLRDLARVVVPRLADWCAVELVSESGALVQVSMHHVDPARAGVASELLGEAPSVVAADDGPEWVREVDPARLRALARSEEHLAALQRLGLTSYVRLPLVARGTMLGVLTLAYGDSGRRYRASDVALAVDLARRAATAVDNANLHQQLRDEHRRKDEFLATLAHELRNPLAPLRSGLAILRAGASAEDGARVRQVMERQLEHLVRLVDDLLDLARVNRGAVELRAEELDVPTLVESALEVSRPALDAAGLDVRVVLPGGPPAALRGDRTRLAQVISNLLNNAAKYTPRGGSVRLSATVDDGWVVLRVEDDGRGIPRALLDHVFAMFARVDPAGDASHPGLGIGLTLVRRLVELHGGQVWAESEGPGKGSTFVVRLPALPASVAAGPAPGAPAPTPPAAPEHRRRVLVVDDNEDAADLLTTFLAMEGHDVRSASSGPAALELVASGFRPEIGLLDIGLPGMSGHELARRLRSEPGLERVVLVALTGWGQAEDRRRSAEAGIDHHVTKPVEPERLRALLAACPRTPP